MKFTNIGEKKFFTFGNVGTGEYFRYKDGFYIKTDIDNKKGDFYSIELETGEGLIIPRLSEVEPINITEIIYTEV